MLKRIYVRAKVFRINFVILFDFIAADCRFESERELTSSRDGSEENVRCEVKTDMHQKELVFV